MSNKSGKTDKYEGAQMPAPQALRRKSRGGEQINFTLPSVATGTAYTSNQTWDGLKASSCHKRKRHWRSPSNPIDFMDCMRKGREKEGIEEITMLTRPTSADKFNMLKTPFKKMTNTALCTSTTPALQSPINIVQQLNFSTDTATFTDLTGSAAGINSEMTVIKRQQPPRHCSTSMALQSYEIQLRRKPQERTFPMIAELSISPIVSSGNSSDYTSTRRHVIKFDSAYCQPASPQPSNFDSTSLAHGHIEPQAGSKSKVTFSRCSLLQLILRNPEDNSVAGIFVVKLDLTDMPPDSRTILLQKAYKSKCLLEDDIRSGNSPCDNSPDYLAKFIEIPLKRVYDPDANRQRILLAGPIRVAFSFNRSNLRYTSPRRLDASAVEPVQKTRTVLQFPSQTLKYFPIEAAPVGNLRTNSLTTDFLDNRSFQHGSLCL